MEPRENPGLGFLLYKFLWGKNIYQVYRGFIRKGEKVRKELGKKGVVKRHVLQFHVFSKGLGDLIIFKGLEKKGLILG